MRQPLRRLVTLDVRLSGNLFIGLYALQALAFGASVFIRPVFPGFFTPPVAALFYAPSADYAIGGGVE